VLLSLSHDITLRHLSVLRRKNVVVILNPSSCQTESFLSEQLACSDVASICIAVSHRRELIHRTLVVQRHYSLISRQHRRLAAVVSPGTLLHCRLTWRRDDLSLPNRWVTDDLCLLMNGANLLLLQPAEFNITRTLAPV